jgi:hypothetical protein
MPLGPAEIVALRTVGRREGMAVVRPAEFMIFRVIRRCAGAKDLSDGPWSVPCFSETGPVAVHSTPNVR